MIKPLWDEFERMSAARDTAFAERDAAFAERDAAFVDRDTALAERDAAISERDAAQMARSDALIIDKIKYRERLLLSNYTRNVYSMISIEEKELLAFLAEEFYVGDGIIFDGGIFLGASTLCFYEGLKRRSVPYRTNTLKPIQAFDLGICEEYTADIVNHIWNTTLKPGDSFIEYTKINLSGVQDIIDIHVGNVMETAKNISRSIEILFYDCGKTPGVDEFMIKNVFTKLIPGRSILIHQDFFFELGPWLHVSQGFLWNKFQYLGAFATSAVFLCTDRISDADVSQYSWDAISYEEAIRLSQVCIDATQDLGRRYLLELAQCALAGYKGSPEDGVRKIQALTVPDRRLTTHGIELNPPDRVLGLLNAASDKLRNSGSSRHKAP